MTSEISDNTPRRQTPPPDFDKLTPAMRQYWEQKQQAGDAILLFRMGDFYELFYDDATLAADVLGITLTSRDKGGTPLAGIPYHALEGYLAKLVTAGYKVAISEQIEDAAQAKGVVKRAIVRIVTPGTLTDDGLLDQGTSNVLAAVCPDGSNIGLATLELSTGQLVVQTFPEPAMLDELTRVGPAEILLGDHEGVGRHPLHEPLRDRTGALVTTRPATDFTPHRAEQMLLEQFEVRGLVGFGFERMDASLQAAGALLAYVRETQLGTIRHLRPPRRQSHSEYLVLDQTTLRSLEVERTLRGSGRSGTLLKAVDGTATAMGARQLRHWLCYPLRQADAIRQRQRLIEVLREAGPERQDLQGALKRCGDIERMVGRLGVGRTHARELRQLGDSLAQLPQIRERLRGLHSPETDALIDHLDGLDDVSERLTTALREDAPLTLREGDMFADGFHEDLDRLRSINRDGQAWLREYQRKETEATGIPTLKVGFNRVFGYYIEVTTPHRDRVPEHYVRKQTLKNAERFITDELKKYENEALSAESRANELEYALFQELREEIAAHIPRLQQAAQALAVIDVLAGWATLSLERNFCRPDLVEDLVLEIEGGRHPVLDATMGPEFVPNDTFLWSRSSGPTALDGGADAHGSLALITGPNMAGKSTYIRQVALLTLLAHCGCWVPAARMRFGLVDRIFTRVGASDELSRGQSTFMVEMLETANILHNATADSLVILDEIGRGTSTFDGLALAWAITEYLAQDRGCRSLFATHYHELTELPELLDGICNLNVEVREFEDRIVFLHRIQPGAADRSYGLHVAKLAGIGHDVLERANAVLNELEQTFGRETKRPVLAAVQRRRQRQLRLFEAPEEKIVREIRELSKPLDAEQAEKRIADWRRQLGLPAPGEDA